MSLYARATDGLSPEDAVCVRPPVGPVTEASGERTLPIVGVALGTPRTRSTSQDAAFEGLSVVLRGAEFDHAAYLEGRTVSLAAEG